PKSKSSMGGSSSGAAPDARLRPSGDLCKLSYCPTIRPSVNERKIHVSSPFAPRRSAGACGRRPTERAGGALVRSRRSRPGVYTGRRRDRGEDPRARAARGRRSSAGDRTGAAISSTSLDRARSAAAARKRGLDQASARRASGMRHALVLHDVTFVAVWEAMMVSEPEVAALAAMRRTQADLAALAAAHEAFKASPQGDPHAVEIVARFFELLGAAARNQVL